MLTFNLKKEWFDKIKLGEITHEYREVKPYWTTRLKGTMRMLKEEKNGELIRETNDPLFMCNICCGYPDWWNDKRRLFVNIKSIRIVNGKHTDLAIDKPVYDIEFELIKRKGNRNGINNNGK